MVDRSNLSTNSIFNILKEVAGISPFGVPFEVVSASNVEVKPEKNKTTVLFGLPGVDPEDLDVEVDNHTVSVSVAKPERTETETPVEGETADADKSEDKAKDEPKSWYEGFKQSIPLPKDVSPEDVTAELKNGLLTVVLPVSENKRARKVNVSR